MLKTDFAERVSEFVRRRGCRVLLRCANAERRDASAEDDFFFDAGLFEHRIFQRDAPGFVARNVVAVFADHVQCGVDVGVAQREFGGGLRDLINHRRRENVNFADRGVEERHVFGTRGRLEPPLGGDREAIFFVKLPGVVAEKSLDAGLECHGGVFKFCPTFTHFAPRVKCFALVFGVVFYFFRRLDYMILNNNNALFFNKKQFLLTCFPGLFPGCSQVVRGGGVKNFQKNSFWAVAPLGVLTPKECIRKTITN